MKSQEKNVENWTIVPGWDGATQTYVDLDCERWIQENGIREAGRADGKQNFPHSDADQPDQTHMRIIEWVNKRGKTCHADVSKYLVQQRYNLEIESKEGMAPFQHKVEELRDQGVQELSGQGEEDRSILVQKKREAQDAWEVLETFKTKAKLERVAEYNERDTWYWWLLGIIAIEAIVNATILSDVVEGGQLGAIGIMLGIGVVNAGILGFMLGEGWRQKNSVKLSAKLTGLIMIIVGTVGMVFWNLLVGHFRDSKKNILDNIDATTPTLSTLEKNSLDTSLADDTIRNFLNSPFGIENMESWVLALVGIGCCVFAASKWLNRDDVYPEYGTRHRTATEYDEEYKQESVQRRKDLKNTYQTWIDRINDERNKVENKRGNYELITQTAKDIVRQFRMQLRQYQHNLDFILTAYRSENERARVTDSPKFFTKQYTIDLDMLEPPVWEDAPKSNYNPEWEGFHQASGAVLQAYKKAQNGYPDA